MKKFLFRVDSSFKIGSGHLVRCLNLANRLKGDIHFVCKTDEGNFNLLITNANYHLHIVDKEEDVYKIAENLKPSSIVIDHYEISIEHEKEFKKYCQKLLVIDDIDREHFCDCVLDQNLKSSYLNSYFKVKHFLGPEFCLINPSFQKIALKELDLDKVMIFFGGSDPASMTLRFSRIITQLLRDINFEVVVGKSNKDFEQIKTETSGLDNVNIHYDINYMPELMSNCSVFFGAGGSTTWERAILGISSLVISIADNQVEVSKYLDQKNIISYLGKSDELDDKKIIDSFNQFIQNKEKRKILKQNSLELNVASKLSKVIYYLQNDT